MKNQVYTGTPTSRRFAKCPTTIKSGDPVLIGSEPGCALDDYSPVTGGTVFSTGGTYMFTVKGVTVISPQSTVALLPGQKVYADTDGQTYTAGGANVYYGFSLDGNSGGTLFGVIDPSYTGGVAAGSTDTAAQVRLLGGE